MCGLSLKFDGAVGRPIKVERIEKPTSKDLEEVQQRYIDELMHIWVRRWATAATSDLDRTRIKSATAPRDAR